MMVQPEGEAQSDALRLDFDRRLKLEFHGSSVTSHAWASRGNTWLMAARAGMVGGVVAQGDQNAASTGPVGPWLHGKPL